MSRRLPWLAGGFVLILVLGWYATVWRPVAAHGRQAATAEVLGLARQQSLRLELARLVALQRTLPAQEAKLARTTTAVPTTESIPGLIDQVDAIATADAIAWTNESQSVSPATTDSSSSGEATDSSSSGDATVSLSLEVSGSLAAMDTFIGDLGDRPRLIVIDSLGYAPATGDTVAVTIAARAFYNATPSPGQTGAKIGL